MRSIFTITMIVLVLAFFKDGKAQLREEGFGGSQPVSKSIHIYPNPTNDLTDFVNIRITPLKSQKVKLTLRNIIGNEITADYEAIDDHELKLRVKDLAPGFYLVTIKDVSTNFRGTYKFLKR